MYFRIIPNFYCIFRVNELKEIESLTKNQPELEPLAEAIEECFCELFDIFGDGDLIEDFQLDKEAGHIVIIENNIDARTAINTLELNRRTKKENRAA